MAQYILYITAALLLTLQSTQQLAISSSNSSNRNSTAATIPDGRIVGGMEASIQQFPHQVSLQLEKQHICGATILTARIIVSAAHCVVQHNTPQLYGIRAGSQEFAHGGVWIPVRKIIPHMQYEKPSISNNDVAVLSLKESLTFGSNIQPIPLATPLDMRSCNAQTVLFVSGWGTLSSESKMRSQRLRYTTLRLISQKRCAAAYAPAAAITSGMLCAAVPGGGHDSCLGDSGGPLVARVGGRLKLVGIVSFGIGCGNKNFPGVYTRVAIYNEWIKRAMGRL